MSFTSVEYLFFLLAAVVLSRLLGVKAQPVCLLLFSCVYYAAWDVRAFIPLLAATALAYFTGLQIDRISREQERKFIGYGSVAVLIGSLLLLKDLPVSSRPLEWVTPLGVSYYTFKLVSYVLDVLWKKQRAEQDPLAFASYAIFFPQIIAGPIQRSGDYLSQLRNRKPFSKSLLYRATSRIALGLLKKLLIADRLAIFLNSVYRDVHSFSGAPLLMTFYLFPLLLYADFSGLTDIAIGSALLFGIESPENFQYPFAAVNISDYWRRWHMSLTSWTADYVFTPLRMATRNWGQAGLVFSICTNMMCVALWHGIRWNFFAFGVVHSAFVSIDALTTKARKTFFKSHVSWKPWAGILGAVFTFHLVAAGMVFWRARTVSDALWILTRMWVGLGAFASVIAEWMASSEWKALAFGLAVYIVVLCGVQLWKRQTRIVNFDRTPRWFRWSAQGICLLVLFTGLLLMFVHGSVKQPFLYEVF